MNKSLKSENLQKLRVEFYNIIASLKSVNHSNLHRVKLCWSLNDFPTGGYMAPVEEWEITDTIKSVEETKESKIQFLNTIFPEGSTNEFTQLRISLGLIIKYRFIQKTKLLATVCSDRNAQKSLADNLYKYKNMYNLCAKGHTNISDDVMKMNASSYTGSLDAAIWFCAFDAIYLHDIADTPGKVVSEAIKNGVLPIMWSGTPFKGQVLGVALGEMRSP